MVGEISLSEQSKARERVEFAKPKPPDRDALSAQKPTPSTILAIVSAATVLSVMPQSRSRVAAFVLRAQETLSTF
jgi:hypothetical protein